MDVLHEKVTFLITGTDTSFVNRRSGTTAEVLDDRHVKIYNWMTAEISENSRSREIS